MTTANSIPKPQNVVLPWWNAFPCVANGADAAWDLLPHRRWLVRQALKMRKHGTIDATGWRKLVSRTATSTKPKGATILPVKRSAVAGSSIGSHYCEARTA
jgi:hypothetical protein